jgi:hypothetical protein
MPLFVLNLVGLEVMALIHWSINKFSSSADDCLGERPEEGSASRAVRSAEDEKPQLDSAHALAAPCAHLSHGCTVENCALPPRSTCVVLQF